LFLRAERGQNGSSDAFQWAAPPRVERTNAFPLQLKEWDTEVSEDEVFDLHILEDFEHNLDDQADGVEKEAPLFVLDRLHAILHAHGEMPRTNLNYAPMVHQLSLGVDRYPMPNLVPKVGARLLPPCPKLC
jgi:hypothetical protein